MTEARPNPRRWKALAVLALVQFLVFTDGTIVNVALPSIQQDLDLGQSALTWVVNGYLLAAGGLLLLGGRLADLVGRRAIFMAGATLFALASLAAALAGSAEMLVAARFAQGVGEALAVPSAMSLVALLFTDDGERAKAFGVWGGLAGLGSTAGVLLGGVLTDLISWHWIFYVNVPLALGAVLLVPRLIEESRAPGGARPDWTGAVLITGGLIAVIQGILSLAEHPFASVNVLAPLLGGLAAVTLFVFLQSRVANPLVPLRFFRHRVRVTGNVAMVFLSSSTAAMFFLTVVYVQQILGFTPLQSGLAWLPFIATFMIGLTVTMNLLPKIGPRWLISGALLLAGVGMLLLARIPVDGSYPADLLFPLLLIGLGGGAATPATQVAALTDVSGEDAGLGSGVITTVLQLGQALGLATIVTVATAYAADNGGTVQAITEGDQLAFLVAGAVLVTGSLVVALLLRAKKSPAAAPAGDVAGIGA
ncbi:MFS transporter [Actinocorallia sp. API 0066]|uniref:MFS transporter n=1 Tax=Actinocorallia sp. API 0066 TaxID=2896846 RepID=UPI001E34D6E5|nr:MFS transporter [Actinocorallia sp. API 0066]MCD0447741.1 MFS transporter [Actinocorallia sp. API 0066]